jgi:hypothetical protein
MIDSRSCMRSRWMLTPNPGYSNSSLANANLVAKQDFCGGSLPSSVASSRDHEAATRVEIELRYHSSAMPWYDQKRYGCTLVASVYFLLLAEVIDSKNVVRCTESS